MKHVTLRRVAVAATLVVGGGVVGAVVDTTVIHHTPPAAVVTQHPGGPVAKPPTIHRPTPPPYVADYTVVPGDVLSNIAAADGTSLANLEAVNPQITTPGLIHPGDIVHLPNALQTTPVRLPVPPPVRPCDGNISVTEGMPDGFPGHQSVAMEVTNHSTQACTLEGYPSVSVSGTANVPIAVTVTDGGGQSTQTPPSVVTLKPGNTAVFRLEWSDVTENPAGCINGTILKVILPGQTAREQASMTSAPVTACPPGTATTPAVSVGPVTDIGY